GRIGRDEADRYAMWYGVRKKWGMLSYFDAPSDNLFYGGRNEQRVEDAMFLIDMGSMLASVVSADIVFDAIGSYYAFSNERYTEATWYGASVFLPVVSGGARRLVMEGKALVVKTLKGELVAVPRSVLGVKASRAADDGPADFISSVLTD